VAPAPKKETPPETVVAQINGKDWTAGEVTKLVSEFPPQAQKAFSADPARTLTSILMLQHLAKQAEFHNLDKEPQFRQNLEFSRLQMLWQAEMNDFRNHITVAPEQEKKRYEERKDNYRQAKVKVIYISFLAAAPHPASADTPKRLTEAEAKAKIDDLRKQAVAGADFGKLAKENSEEKTSAAKDGDFPDISPTSPFPENVKKAVMALKAGEISEPVRQPNGFYLFKVGEVKTQPFEEVKDKIHQDMVQEEFNGFMKSIEARFKVDVKDAGFFAPGPGPR
jgi:parvulin-like peptidyl-prolyl isomerase